MYTDVSTHSRPKAAGNGMTTRETGLPLFQHTAARRRLAFAQALPGVAADGFNTQPPEGGWIWSMKRWIY